MFPSQSNIRRVCDLLTEKEDQTSSDALSLIREMDKCLSEFVHVAPSFPELVKLTEALINATKKPGEEPTTLEVVVSSQAQLDVQVDLEQVPACSKPYMEVLRLYVSLRRRENVIN